MCRVSPVLLLRHATKFPAPDTAACRSAAEYILAHMPPGRYRGVTYFCPAAGCWVILDPVGRASPKASSHLAEADTLALFDDARCRCGVSLEIASVAQRTQEQQHPASGEF